MKKLLFLILLLSASGASADYIPPSIKKLMLVSDKVIYGEIICVDKQVVEVLVCDAVNHSAETITFNRFVEWECGKRWTDYEVGQSSLFFLRYWNGNYRPMGGGNEGELPIDEDQVYVHQSTITSYFPVEQFKRSDQKLYNDGYSNPYSGYVFDLMNFWNATRSLKNCFTANKSQTGNPINITLQCDEAELELLMDENEILDWVVNKLK